MRKPIKFDRFPHSRRRERTVRCPQGPRSEEVAEAVVWLASDGAAAINGQAIVIDGGGIQA